MINRKENDIIQLIMGGKRERELQHSQKTEVTANSFQAMFDKFAQTELPKLNAFREQLTTQAKLLREGQISERKFFETLTANREPLRLISVRTQEGEGEEMDEGTIGVERTANGKLKVRSQQVAAWPQITVTVGLSKDGLLYPEHVDARYVEQDSYIMKPHAVKGDMIYTDVIGALTPKQEAGEALINDLKHVIPHPDDSKVAK
ncbi:MAG: hypothetical protein Q8P26_03540 [Candidatus Levybacteria bacterium]|nr:hypothetical protein [Candidatus Levybacteria bacterium]